MTNFRGIIWSLSPIITMERNRIKFVINKFILRIVILLVFLFIGFVNFAHASECKKEDKKTLLEHIKESPSSYILKGLSPCFKKDKEIALEVLQVYGLGLQYVDESLKKDKDVVLQAVQTAGMALKFAHETLKNDRAIVLTAVTSDGDALLYASQSLKKDKQFVLQAIKIDPRVLGRVDVDQAFSKDKDFVLNAVINNGVAFKYANHNLKKDKGFVLKVVKIEGRAISFADDLLKKDKEVVLAAVKENGLALSIVDESLKKDKEVVLEAVKNDSRAFEYADESLKKDDDILFAAQAKEFSNDTDEIGTPYIKPNGWKIRSSHIVLSPDGKQMYTIFKNRFYLFQLKPFKLLQEHETPLDVKNHLAFDLSLTGDEKHLVLTMPNKIVLYDFSRKKIVRSIELKDHELKDSVLNGNELVVFTKDSNLKAYQNKHPDADRDHLLNQPGNLLVYDVYSLKLKSNTEFHIEDDSPYGVWIARLNIIGEYISLFRRQYQQYSWVFLDRNTYKPRLVFTMLASGSVKVSSGMKNIYLPHVYGNIFFNQRPSYAVSADGKVSRFPSKQNAWFSLKDKQFIDPETSSERIKKLEQSPLFFSPFALQLSQTGDYIATTGARIFNLKTKQVFSLYQFENKQAVFIERTTGHFEMTEHARKHLTMKTKSGYIVPINNATFMKYNMKVAKP